MLYKAFVKKAVNIEDVVLGNKVTIAIDEQLNKLKFKALAPRKPAQANKSLRGFMTKRSGRFGDYIYLITLSRQIFFKFCRG